ncbi:MAG: hypothetical protein Kow0089_16100 [Desulfobulbaceae bacterium]
MKPNPPKAAKPGKKNKDAGSSSKKKKLYSVSFYHDWCKQCGLCMAFCPKQIITADKTGKPEIMDEDKCIGCRFCEMHCPDFAITVEERTPKRRKTDE